MTAPALALLWLAGGGRSVTAEGQPADAKAVIREDISVRAKPTGAAVALPTPRPETAVVDEVIDSLDLMKSRHSVAVAGVKLPRSAKLSRPFPGAPYIEFSPKMVSAPYDLWTFEVLDGEGQLLMRQDGTGRVVEPLEWDGSGPTSDEAVLVGGSYHFRFTGRRGPDAFVVTSEPALLRSLATREYLGGTRLEVSNEELFAPGEAKLGPRAAQYLNVIADRLRRIPPRDGYRLQLRQKDPKTDLSTQRAAALRRWLSDALVVNADLVRVEILGPGARGDVTACLLPADKGDAIRE
jgi:hypothetical protein